MPNGSLHSLILRLTGISIPGHSLASCLYFCCFNIIFNIDVCLDGDIIYFSDNVIKLYD